MKLMDELLGLLPEGDVIKASIGLHWTAVVVNVGGEQRCGLASTLSHGRGHAHHKGPDIPDAGELESLTGRVVAAFSLCKEQPTLASVGIAALNALLPRAPDTWTEANAEEMISKYGQGKRVVMVGHFPFVERLRERVGELIVLEKDPGPDDLPAESAPQVLPGAEVVAITAMTVANYTLEGLLEYCAPEAFVMLLGPSTPLSPVLFRYGVNMLSGAIVTDIEPVLRVITQGGNFRQVHRAGVQLVNMQK